MSPLCPPNVARLFYGVQSAVKTRIKTNEDVEEANFLSLLDEASSWATIANDVR